MRRFIRQFGSARMVRNFDVTLFETTTMDVPQLLDAIERSSRVYSNSKPALWDRLIARTRALLPGMTGDDVSRILHAFHVGGAKDIGLLEEICTELDEDMKFRGPNDIAVFAHALSLHQNVATVELREKFAKWLLNNSVGKNTTLTAGDLFVLLRGVRVLLSDNATSSNLPANDLFKDEIVACALKYATPSEIVDLCTECSLWDQMDSVDACLSRLVKRDCVQILDGKECIRLLHAVAREGYFHECINLIIKRIVSTCAFLSVDELMAFLEDVIKLKMNDCPDLSMVLMRLTKRVGGLSWAQRERLLPIAKHFSCADQLHTNLTNLLAEHAKQETTLNAF